MSKKVFILFLLLTISIQAQYSVSGKINSDNDYSWILLYKIENGKQVYIENANVENNTFKFSFNSSQLPGIYRVYYQIKDKSYIEFIYNNESIDFTFNPNNPTESIKFNISEENKIYQQYYQDISFQQKKIDSIQMAYFKSNDAKEDSNLMKSYKKELYELQKKQAHFEKISEGKMVYHFIKASVRYNADKPFKNPQEYIKVAKKHFFDGLDFSDPVLRNATFINDRITDYVFYLNQSDNIEKRNSLQKEAIIEVSIKLNNDYDLIKNFDETVLKQYAEEENIEMVNFVLDKYYNKLPNEYQDFALKHKIKSDLKTSLGKKAPNIEWEENGTKKTLYDLTGSDYYIVVFFSSGCSHCQKQMPIFHDFISTILNVSVVAVGLEDEKASWDKMVADFRNFTNILDLDKWKSKRAKAYGVTAIPSFFILDANKNIIAKPNNVEELKKLFEEK